MGVEYNEDGKIIFEGEYSNGIKWNGKIKEYCYKIKKLFLKENI